jgi:hypothetical protein
MLRLFWALVPLLLMARPRGDSGSSSPQVGRLSLPDTPPPGVSPAEFHPTIDVEGGGPNLPVGPPPAPGPTPAPAPAEPELPDTAPPGVSQETFERTISPQVGGGGFWSLPLFSGGFYGFTRAVQEAATRGEQPGGVMPTWPGAAEDPGNGPIDDGPAAA